MRIGILRSYLGPILVAALALFGFAGTAMGVTSLSPNYQVTDTQFGTGTAIHGCSDQYCARVSIGDMSEGEAPRPSTAEFDEDVGSEPLIEVIIEPGESNLGVLTTEQTATKTTAIKIRNHLSGGYALQIMGDPPKFDGHTLSTPSVPTASVPGTEQFAINLSANTKPVVGADPIFKPASQSAFVDIDERYAMSDLFKYTNGDVVARSTSDSGRVDYTISMIVNISNSTPAGHYSGDFYVLVVPAY